MPVPASQRRALIVAYRNRLQHYSRSSATSAQSKKPSHSAIPDKTRRFGNRICRAVNSDEELCRLPSHKTVMPLSQIRLAGSPLTTISENPEFVSNKDISLTFSADTDHPDNNGNIFVTILYPVANALYEARGLISRFDPLTFSGAEAVPLSLMETGSEMSIETFNAIKNGNELISDERKEKKM